MEIVKFRAMNTEIILAAEGTLEKLQPGFEKTTRFIHESEQKFTRFSSNSELSQLNNAAGAWFHASPDLLEVILLARTYVEQTRGLFDPSILEYLKQLGYDRSMELIRANAGAAFIYPGPSPREHVPFDEIIINPEESLISLPAGLSLDLGGIAKGWIAEQAACLLSEYSPACCVSAGGDMHMLGLPDGLPGWQVDLEDPRNPGEILANLNLPSGGLATSSITKRTWKQGEKMRHHLIDPRSGEPAQTEWLSVTVIAAHTTQCEAFAKALLIAGPGEAPIIAQNMQIAYLAVDHEGNILGTQNCLEYIL